MKSSEALNEDFSAVTLAYTAVIDGSTPRRFTGVFIHKIHFTNLFFWRVGN